MREADAQFGNYEKLFEYINNTPELNAEVKFGTLADYFALVEKGRPIEKAPSVTGDFFSYSDRVDNYWTGFFNSRPFYKWYDRYLEHWIQGMRKKTFSELFEPAYILHFSCIIRIIFPNFKTSFLIYIPKNVCFMINSEFDHFKGSIQRYTKTPKLNNFVR